MASLTDQHIRLLRIVRDLASEQRDGVIDQISIDEDDFAAMQDLRFDGMIRCGRIQSFMNGHIFYSISITKSGQFALARAGL